MSLTPIQQLCEMGFDEERASIALAVCRNDLGRATEWLLSHPLRTQEPQEPPAPQRENPRPAPQPTVSPPLTNSYSPIPVREYTPNPTPVAPAKLYYQRPLAQKNTAYKSVPVTSSNSSSMLSRAEWGSGDVQALTAHLDLLQLKITKLKERKEQIGNGDTGIYGRGNVDKKDTQFGITNPKKPDSDLNLQPQYMEPSFGSPNGSESPYAREALRTENAQFSAQEINELDQQFKTIITGYAASGIRDISGLLYGQFSVVLSSNHPVGLKCSFLQNWNSPYVRVESPSHSLLSTIANGFEDLMIKCRDHLLDYYPFLKGIELVKINQAVYEAGMDIIYPSFMLLIKKSVVSKDIKWKETLTVIHSCTTITPQTFGLPPLLCLPSPTGVPSSHAYSKSIEILSRLPSCKTVQKKLAILVDTATQLVEDVNAHYKQGRATNDSFTITADELLPLMAYVLSKANIENIYCETTFMDLLSPSQTGKEGYMLATFVTAIDVIFHLHSKLLSGVATNL